MDHKITYLEVPKLCRFYTLLLFFFYFISEKQFFLQTCNAIALDLLYVEQVDTQNRCTYVQKYMHKPTYLDS